MSDERYEFKGSSGPIAVNKIHQSDEASIVSIGISPPNIEIISYMDENSVVTFWLIDHQDLSVRFINLDEQDKLGMPQDLLDVIKQAHERVGGHGTFA